MKIDRKPQLPVWHEDTDIYDGPGPGKPMSIPGVICTLLIALGAALLFLWFLFVALMNLAINNAG